MNAQYWTRGRLILFLTLLSLFLIFHVWVRTKSIDEGFKLQKAKVELQKLEAERSQFLLEKEKLTSPKNLEELVDKIDQGFDIPKKEQVFYVFEK